MIFKYNLGGLVTVMNSDGKPTQVPASSLNMSGGLQGGAAGFSSSSSIAAGICLRFYKKNFSTFKHFQTIKVGLVLIH